MIPRLPSKSTAFKNLLGISVLWLALMLCSNAVNYNASFCSGVFLLLWIFFALVLAFKHWQDKRILAAASALRMREAQAEPDEIPMSSPGSDMMRLPPPLQ